LKLLMRLRVRSCLGINLLTESNLRIPLKSRKRFLKSFLKILKRTVKLIKKRV